MSGVINEAVKNSAAHAGGPGFFDPTAPRERVKKSRWSTNKAFVPGMPTILPSNLDDTQRQGYLRKFFKYRFELTCINFSAIGN